MIEKLEISAIDRTGLNTRATLNAEAVRDYANTMQENPEALPPIAVFRTSEGKLLLADGFHRIAAALSLGLTEIAADVHEGEHPVALREALVANVKHGMRRTGADKRQSMNIAWEHRKELFGGDPTEREFATVCAVSNGLAHSFMQDMRLLTVSKIQQKPAEEGESEAAIEPARGRAGVVCVPAEKLRFEGRAKRGDSRRPSVPSRRSDRFKLEIPEALLDVFNSRGIASAGSLIKKARRILKLGIDKGDRAFAALSWQRVDTTIENLLNELRFSLPYCVCRMCRGFGCDACGNRGFQTKPEFSRNPEEYKIVTI